MAPPSHEGSVSAKPPRKEPAARGRQAPARSSGALQSGWGVPGATSPEASSESHLPLMYRQPQTSLSPFSFFLQPLEEQFLRKILHFRKGCGPLF